MIRVGDNLRQVEKVKLVFSTFLYKLYRMKIFHPSYFHFTVIKHIHQTYFLNFYFYKIKNKNKHTLKYFSVINERYTRR